MSPNIRLLVCLVCSFLSTASTTRAGDLYSQTNLVSDGAVAAQQIDPNLKDPWGLAISKTSPFWISDQAANVTVGGNPTSVTTLYTVPAGPPGNGLATNGTVTTFGVVNQGGAAPNGENNGPTGQVSTTAAGITTSATTDFQFTAGGSTGRAAFIFANLDGSISAWKGGLAESVVQPTAVIPGASFTGLAIGNTSTGAAQLYAADQNSGNVYIFNNKWQMTGTITDPNGLPAGYKAFNVQNLSVNGVQTLFVTYANQSTSGGIVVEYNTNGGYIQTLINDQAGANLNAPWGLAIAPSNFGAFSGDLLVGNNNGPGEINAYNLSGGLEGTLMLNNAADLWALSFGNGGNGGAQNVLYFTAGLDSNTDGLFGAISAVPEPSTGVLAFIAMAVLAARVTYKKARRV